LVRRFPVAEVEWYAALNKSLRNSTVIWICDSAHSSPGFPLKEEAEYFSQLVLPYLPNASLPELHNSIPKNKPVTPLTSAFFNKANT